MTNSAALLAFSSVLLAHLPALHAQATAYDALRAVGTQRGTGLYSQLISINGKNATPQPSAWTLLFHDPSSPTRLREFTVEGSRIVGERTPVDAKLAQRGPSAAMDIKRLNLNSDGVFKIVEIEARNQKIGFDAANYLLRAHEVTGQPVWIVELLNARRRRISAAMVSAETGRTLRPPVLGSQHTIPSDEPLPPPPPRQAKGPNAQGPGNPSSSFLQRFGQTMDKTARSIEQQLVAFGDFLTGKDRKQE